MLNIESEKLLTDLNNHYSIWCNSCLSESFKRSFTFSPPAQVLHHMLVCNSCSVVVSYITCCNTCNFLSVYRSELITVIEKEEATKNTKPIHYIQYIMGHVRRENLTLWTSRQENVESIWGAESLANDRLRDTTQRPQHNWSESWGNSIGNGHSSWRGGNDNGENSRNSWLGAQSNRNSGSLTANTARE